MRQLGREMNVPVLDLNKKSIDYYNEIGVEATKNVFMFLEPGKARIIQTESRTGCMFTSSAPTNWRGS